MIRTLVPSMLFLLALACVLPAQPGPALDVAADLRRPAGVMHLARLSLRADIDDGVARVRVSQTFRNAQHSRPPGDEAVTSFDVSPLTAFWRYRITEEGKWWDGLLLPRQEGRAEYDRTVRRSRDPGLLEWQEACRYTSSVYPVPPDGGTKDVEFEYDEALRLTTGGMLLFRFPLGAWLAEEVELEFSVRDGRGLSGYRASPELPAGHAPDGGESCSFTAHLRPEGMLPDLELRLQLARPFAGAGGRAARPLELPGGEVLVPIPVSDADLESRAVTGGFLIGKRRGQAPSGVVRLGTFTPVPNGPERQPALEVEADLSAKLTLPATQAPAWARLREQAEAQSLFLERFADRAAPPSARTTRFSCVSPFGSFLAKPAPDPERKLPVPGGVTAPGQTPRLEPLPSGAGATRPSGDSGWHFSPLANFRAARQQANDRACFANQRVLAGGLEMYELDTNVRVAGPGGMADRAAFRPLFSPAPDAPYELLAVHPVRPPWRPGRWVDELPVSLWKELVAGGYLHAKLECPGAGRDSWTNYVLLQPEGKVVCLRHGAYDATGSSRQQLVQAGVNDPATLARAETLDWVAERRRRAFWAVVGELAELLGLVLMLGCIVWGLQLLGASWRVLCVAAAALIASGVMLLQLPRELRYEETGLLLLVPGIALVAGLLGRLLLMGLGMAARRCSVLFAPAIRGKLDERDPAS